MILFVVGPPGVGKTTLVRHLLEPDSYLILKPKWTVGQQVVAAGHYSGGTFDGADTVPYNGAKDCLRYWAENFTSKKLTVFDGDRFSNSSALEFFQSQAQELVCLHLAASEPVLQERRQLRGSNQNATWLKGRVTKAENFVNNFPGRRLYMNNMDRSGAELVTYLKGQLGL